MSIIVTGGNGFIGTNFIKSMLTVPIPYNVINIDKMTSVSSNVSDNLIKGCQYRKINGDINNIDELDVQNLNCVRYLIHFAAESHVDNSMQDTQPFIRTNVQGTYAVARFCAENRIPMIHISTDEVYGHVALDSEEQYTVESPLNPRNPYAVTKAGAELWLPCVKNIYPEFRYMIIRPSNNYGMYQDKTKFIPKAMKYIYEGIPFPMYGNGLFKREWTYVGDTVRILRLISENTNMYRDGSNIHNISSNQSFSNIEVFSIIGEEFKSFDKKYTPMIEFIPDPRGGAHDLRYAIKDSGRLDMGFREFRSKIKELVGNFITEGKI